MKNSRKKPKTPQCLVCLIISSSMLPPSATWTWKITTTQIKSHMKRKEFVVSFFVSKSTSGNFIEETKEDFVAPKQVLFFWHFFIIRREEPYFGDCPYMWKHNVFSPWASMCEVMFAKVVHQRMTFCHACWSCARNGAKFISFSVNFKVHSSYFWHFNNFFPKKLF